MLRDWQVIVIVCWVSAMAAIVYAAQSGAAWPLPFALFVMVLGGVSHLVAARRGL